MNRSFGALAVIAATVISAAALAQDDGTQNVFKDRLTPTYLDRADFIPTEAGYYKLVVTPLYLQNKILCPANREEEEIWKREIKDVWKEFIGENRESGLALSVWLGDGTGPSTFDRNIFSVRREPKFGLDACDPAVDMRKAETSLIPFDGPVTQLTYQWNSWNSKKVKKERVTLITGAGEKLLSLAGIPMPAELKGYSETRFLDALQANRKSSVLWEFRIGDPDANKIVTLALAKAGAPPTATDPSVSVRLVTVGSIFGKPLPKYPNLSAVNPDKVLYDTFYGKNPDGTDRTFMDWLASDASGVKDKVALLGGASTPADIETRCGDLWSALRTKTYLSDADAAMTILALVSSRPGMFSKDGGNWIGPFSTIQPSTPFLNTGCAKGIKASLKLVSISLPDYVPDEAPSAASGTQMKEAMLNFLQLARNEDEAVANEEATIARFGATLTVNDPYGLFPSWMTPTETSAGGQTRPFKSATELKPFASAVFEQVGCWLPYPSLSNTVPWPAGYGPANDDSKTRMAQALGVLEKSDSAESETVVLLSFVFDPAIAGNARVSALTVTPLREQDKRAFQDHYANSSCTLKGKLSSAPG